MNLSDAWDAICDHAPMPRETQYAVKEWTRTPGPAGGSCGASHAHRSGWRVLHCGHPTANRPYYVIAWDGTTHFAPNGRGWQHLRDAKAALLALLPNAGGEA